MPVSPPISSQPSAGSAPSHSSKPGSPSDADVRPAPALASEGDRHGHLAIILAGAALLFTVLLTLLIVTAATNA